jgi:hypothetical protein
MMVAVVQHIPRQEHAALLGLGREAALFVVA